MKKKMILSLTAVTALGIFSVAAPALAAENSATSTATDVGIGFKSDDDNSATNGPFKDNLAIVFRPTAFEFGRQNKAGTTTMFSAAKTGSQYIVVNDDRRENDPEKGNKWTVKASLSDMTTDAGDKLASATLTFGNKDNYKLYNYAIGTEMNAAGTDYVPARVDDTEEGGLASSLTEMKDSKFYNAHAVSLKAGSGTAAEVLSKNADDKTIVGGVAYKIENVKLNITDTKDLGGKNYNGTVNWTLETTVK